jgi:NAD(P)-dependent dehydrogenase (short-subunit alcohol dehydrogenase family)
MYNPFSLVNKTVLITGASSGIGRAIAIECSKMGALVVISGRDEFRLKETHSMLVGDQPDFVIADLSTEHGMSCLCNSISNLDGLVNCAGVTRFLPFPFATRKDFNELMAINFFAPCELSRLLVKQKKMIKGSSIVFISSVSGVYCSAPASSIYSATKGAINGLVKGMAIDLAAKAIRVNSVNPGMVETELFKETSIMLEQLEVDKQKYPLKRYGKPEEVAYAVIYLLSDASAWVTGSNVLIDGGYTLL